MGVIASFVGLFLGLALAYGPVFAVRRGRLHAAEQRPPVRDTDDRRLARTGDHRDADRELLPGAASDTRSPDRRRARGRRAAPRAVRALPDTGRGDHHGDRVRADRARALLARHLDRADPADRRHAPRVRRRGDAVGAVHPRSVGVPRLAVDVDRRRRRVAGARQRAPQSTAHGVDRRGADDRARARHARRDARRRDHTDVPRRGERHLLERLRDHSAEQLLADPDPRRRDRSQGAGRDRRRQRPHRRDEGVRRDDANRPR